MDNRALTTNEKKGIRLLVKRHCANRDPSIGCLRMDWPCYMCNKYYTGAFCTYFVKALLPLDSVLEASLQDQRRALKTCAFCQKEFVPKTHERYCGAFCKTEARKETLRKSKRKERASKKSGG